MLLRDCAGGVVFCNKKVFLMLNEKNEWVMPKGLIKCDESPQAASIRRVFEEACINGEIIDQAGRTYYEFYSVTRQMPVCNRIAWYILKTESDKFIISEPEKFTKAGYFTISDALNLVTYSQDKSLLMQSYKKLCEKTGESPVV